MDRNTNGADRIRLREKRGTWMRFVKMLLKCRLPWVWLALYVVLEVGFINIGVSETDYTNQLLAGDTSAALLAKLVGVIALNLVLTNLTIFVGHVTSARINRNMRGIVLDKVLRLPMSYFKDENPRDAIYRIVENAAAVDSTIMFFLLPIATALYKSAVVFGKVFKYDWRLSAILIGFIPVELLLAFLFGRINFSLADREASLRAVLTARLAQLVTNIPLAKAFAKEQKETENGNELVGRLYRLSIKGGWFDQLRDLANSGTDLLKSLAIVLVGVVLLRGEVIEKRAWIAFFSFSSIFSGAVTELATYWNNIKIIQGSAEKVSEIMDFPEEDLSGEPCEALRGDLELEDVRFGYHEDAPVLRGVSCRFQDNAVTALLGASGCGKTTLINLLTRLYEPQGGSVTAGGRPIRGYALEDYRRQFVMVSQSSMLFSGTIRENLLYGNGDVTLDQMNEALKKAGAYDFVMSLPMDLETHVGEYGGDLSGGQRQRLAMARALLSDAHYLILDEPAAAMDALAVSELMEILREVARDRCMIIIAHSKAVLSIAERAIVVENGVVTAEGPTEEVKKTSGFLRALAGSEEVTA